MRISCSNIHPWRPFFSLLNSRAPCLITASGVSYIISQPFGERIPTKTKVGLLYRNVSFVSNKTSQDVEEGSSGEDNDAETPKTKKKPAKCGRKKATIDASDGETQEAQSDTEHASPEEPKKIQKRGRKKAATTASSVEEADKPKEPR